MSTTPLTAVNNGTTLVATLNPAGYDRSLSRIVISGPPASAFSMYLGLVNSAGQVDTTPYGAANSNDYTNPVRIPAGQILYCVWSNDISTGATASLTLDRVT